jgi:HEAT repeat protein
LQNPEQALTVERQVKEELTAVRDCLADRTEEVNVPAAADSVTRRQVAAQLLAAMMGDEGGDESNQSIGAASGAVPGSNAGRIIPAEAQPVQCGDQEQKERARKLFMDHGYFDEAVQNLRDAILPQHRAEAARALGVVGSKRGTPHLIAAMFDDDPEVRSAAEKSLAQMSDSAPPRVEAVSPASGQGDLEEFKANENITADEVGSHELALLNQAQPDRADLRREGKIPAHPSPAQEEILDSPRSVESSASTASTSKSVELDAAGQAQTQETAPQEDRQVTPGVDRETTPVNRHQSTDDAKTAKDPSQLRMEEQSLREVAQQLERQLAAAAIARSELEKEVVLSLERETRFRAEAAARRREEEELRKRADEEAETHRANEREALNAEQLTREQAETEAHWLAEEETRTRLEKINLRKAAEELLWRRMEIENARSEAEAAARRDEAKSSREEAERLHVAELTRLRKEEEALRMATEEAATRRADLEKNHKETKAELERLTKERVQLAAAEAVRHAEATRLRQEARTRHEAEVNQLRSEEEALRAVAEQVARRRAEVAAVQKQAEGEIERLTKERAQLAAAEAARNAESERIREAEARNRADHERLRLELEGLQLVTQEVATRRAAAESARKKADEDAARLLELQVRIRAEEEANARLESQRFQIEAEICQQVKTQQRLLEEARRRAQEVQQRFEDEERIQSEQEEKLRAELVLLRKNAERSALQRAEQEKHVRNQVDSLRIADAEARKRIEEAEAHRRKSEDVYRLVAEKVQRVEAEAHLRAAEEQQILVKLEAVRRTAAIEAQARAEQEKRIKEEIEQFRRLEEVERPRLAVAALQRTQAQALFEQQRERVQTEENIQSEAPETAADHSHPPTNADEAPSNLPRVDMREGQQASVENPPLTDEGSQSEAIDNNEAVAGVAATIQTYLNSVDPYKRAAAVAELARSDGKDAFDLIVKCFDDHSAHVRNAAARALRTLEPNQTVDLFNRALEEGSDERRRNIGAAIAASGLATEAIDNLVGDNREDTYNALLILFVMAKAGEVQPLVNAIEDHENVEVCTAVIKLLTLTGQTKLGDAALQRRVTGVSGARRVVNGLDQQ